MHAPSPELADELAELESIEDFLDYFGIPYERTVVQINRLHILQRFHDYLRSADDPPVYEQWHERLARAYDDYLRSDAITEGVFRVFKRARGIATVQVSDIRRAPR
ncbi:nitrogenase-stabilizing/protective protein NifW [Niveibacterium sp.]|uniref:nitrogenase-stabilizing/protective protein NifW n=1 Tax=Niveibacterium sp. TaxID=2017444 RepID=UPI0035B3E3EB